MHVPKDSMWRRILKSFWILGATKQGMSHLLLLNQECLVGLEHHVVTIAQILCLHLHDVPILGWRMYWPNITWRQRSCLVEGSLVCSNLKSKARGNKRYGASLRRSLCSSYESMEVFTLRLVTAYNSDVVSFALILIVMMMWPSGPISQRQTGTRSINSVWTPSSWNTSWSSWVKPLPFSIDHKLGRGCHLPYTIIDQKTG